MKFIIHLKFCSFKETLCKVHIIQQALLGSERIPGLIVHFSSAIIPVSVIEYRKEDYISLTDMIKAKEGDFFISDWLRNRNTVGYLGIWESINNPLFNYGEFATIKSMAGLQPHGLYLWKAI